MERPTRRPLHLSNHREDSENRKTKAAQNPNPSNEEKPLNEIVAQRSTRIKISSARSKSTPKNLIISRRGEERDLQRHFLELQQEPDQNTTEFVTHTTTRPHDWDNAGSDNADMLPGLTGSKPLPGAEHTQSHEGNSLSASGNLVEEKSAEQSKSTPSFSKSIFHALIPKNEKKPQKVDTVSMVFGKNMQKTIEVLHRSKIYKDTLTKNADDLGFMTPNILDGYLRELVKESAARTTISTYGLSPAEAVAVRFYGLQGFTNVQPALRGKQDKPLPGVPLAPPETFENLVKTIASCFRKLPPLPGEMVLFRGTPYFDFDKSDITEYQDPAFVSTSMDAEVVGKKFPGGYLLMFKVSPTSACRDISTLTGNPLEAEVLFLPGTTFRILSKKEKPDRTRVITLEPTSAPSPWTFGF